VGWAVEIGDEFEPEFDELDHDGWAEILALPARASAVVAQGLFFL
jgi:hypothetical protein